MEKFFVIKETKVSSEDLPELIKDKVIELKEIQKEQLCYGYELYGITVFSGNNNDDINGIKFSVDLDGEEETLECKYIFNLVEENKAFFSVDHLDLNSYYVTETDTRVPITKLLDNYFDKLEEMEG